MLEPVREYAEEALSISGEEPAARQRFANFAAQLAEAVDDQITHHAVDGAALDLVTRELNNIQAAVAWSLQSGETRVYAARIVGALGSFWRYRAAWSAVGYQWTSAVCQDADLAPALLAKVFRAAAHLAWYWMDIHDAIRYGRLSMEQYRLLGDRAGYLGALLTLFTPLLDTGDSAAAEQNARESVALSQAIGDPALLMLATINHGAIAHLQGDDQQAIALLEACQRMADRAGRVNVVWALAKLARILMDTGDLGRCDQLLGDMLAISREHQLDYGVGIALRDQAYLALTRGQVGQARALAAESVAMFSDRLDDPLNEGVSHHFCALIEQAGGALQEAHRHACESARLLREGRDYFHLAITCVGAGATALAAGEAAAATGHYAEALSLFRWLAPGTRGSRTALVALLSGLGDAMAPAAPAQSARLWGAAERLAEGIELHRYALASYGMPLPSADLARHSSAQQQARAALGTPAWAAAWAAGRALSLDELWAEVSQLPHGPWHDHTHARPCASS
jgi:hypothetical protein